MAVRKQIEGSDPVGSDGPGGESLAPDIKKYHTFRIASNKHMFNAPYNKYKDLLGVLGLEDIDSDDAKKEVSQKLQQGTAFINLSIRTNGGASFRVVCDPQKLGTALTEAVKHKIYDQQIKSVRIPKKRIYI